MTADLDGPPGRVAGLGPMGRGIARVFAAAGAQVTVVDIDAAATDAGPRADARGGGLARCRRPAGDPWRELDRRRCR